MDMPYKKGFLNNLLNPCRNISIMNFTKDITVQNLYHLKIFPTKSILIGVMFQHSIILLFSRYRRTKSRTKVMERVLQLTHLSYEPEYGKKAIELAIRKKLIGCPYEF